MIQFKFEAYGRGGVIDIYDDNKYIGHVGFGMAKKHSEDIYPIGYWLVNEYHRQGIMTRAVNHFIEVTKLTHFEAVVLNENIGSQKVLLNNGFERTGQNERMTFFELKKAA